jgi:hypothetical protein
MSAIRARFLKKVIKDTSGCWVWNGASDDRGYGRFLFEGNKVKIAHRFAFEEYNGVTLERTQVVMHTCDNSRCVNPQHLVVGSQSENARDRWARTGRSQSKLERLRKAIRLIVPDVSEKQIDAIVEILGIDRLENFDLAAELKKLARFSEQL